MSAPSFCHWYAKPRGARYRNAPARSEAQLPWLQPSCWPTRSPPETVGAPVPAGARSRAAEAGELSPVDRLEAEPEPVRFATRIAPPPEVAPGSLPGGGAVAAPGGVLSPGDRGAGE